MLKGQFYCYLWKWECEYFLRGINICQINKDDGHSLVIGLYKMYISVVFKVSGGMD